MSRLRSQSASPVPTKELASCFSTFCWYGREATTSCSSACRLPRANNGESAGARCCTTTIGMPAAWAASMAAPMRSSDDWMAGNSIRRLPLTYSFCTSMTSKARLG